MQKLKYILSVFILLLVVLNPVMVLAAVNVNTNVNSNANSSAGGIGTQYTYSGVDQSVTAYLCTPSDPPDGQDLQRCINKLYKVGVAFGAIAVVFFIVLAGYMYITGGESGKTKAKGMLTNSLVGIAILLGSYVLLTFVNPSIVIFKPIQPPIFFAADLPECEEVGLGESCVLPDGSSSTGTGTGNYGARATCPGGKLVSAKGLGLPTKQADEQICEGFGQQLVKIKPLLTGVNWYITDTVGSGHLSKCHSSGNAYTGTCADLGISDKTAANWNKICSAVNSVGGMQNVNEATPDANQCPAYQTYATTTGQNVHVNWRPN
ncbi:MAG TPA: pilin [Patescibacteria group bacterium]|jgi:hypothetical protein|nr:pilin [Patescibacteria group bacterium]